MTIACITPVRDNQDTIELFIRINSKVVDHFYIIDNNSVDATVKILNQLQQEGFNISIKRDKNESFEYAEMVSNALWEINRLKLHEWFLFLDADEFLDQPKAEVRGLLEKTPKHLVPKLLLKSWIPLEDNYDQYDNPLWSMFNPLAIENVTMYKVAIDRARASYSNIVFGAHDIYKIPGNQKADSFRTGIHYNHFPVRSSKQIITKTLLAEQKLLVPSTKVRTHKIFHIEHIAQLIREHNHQIDYPLLKAIAVSYLAEIDQQGNYLKHDQLEPRRFGSPDDKMIYRAT